MPYVEQIVVKPGELVWVRYVANLWLLATVIDPGPLAKPGNLLRLCPPMKGVCPPEHRTKVEIRGLGLRDVESYWIRKPHPLEVLAWEARMSEPTVTKTDLAERLVGGCASCPFLGADLNDNSWQCNAAPEGIEVPVNADAEVVDAVPRRCPLWKEQIIVRLERDGHA